MFRARLVLIDDSREVFESREKTHKLRKSDDLLLAARRNMMTGSRVWMIDPASWLVAHPWFRLPAFKPPKGFISSHHHPSPFTVRETTLSQPDASLSRVSTYTPSLFATHHSFQSALLLSQRQQRKSPLPGLLVEAQTGRRKEHEGSRDAPTTAPADGPQQTASPHPRLRGHGDRPDGPYLHLNSSPLPAAWLMRCSPKASEFLCRTVPSTRYLVLFLVMTPFGHRNSMP